MTDGMRDGIDRELTQFDGVCGEMIRHGILYEREWDPKAGRFGLP